VERYCDQWDWSDRNYVMMLEVGIVGSLLKTIERVFIINASFW
jgi:hypothetical protein